MHHAAFDLAVIDYVIRRVLDIYDWVEADHIFDTQLLHRLLVLGLEGHTASGKGQSTLEHCVQEYLGVSLPKEVLDSRGRPVRRSYGQWLNRPVEDIEPVYLKYLAKDAIATILLYFELQSRLEELLAKSNRAWGYVDRKWLAEQIRRWGWQTHHIQLRAAIALQAVTANGLGIDLDRRDELERNLKVAADEQRAILREYGYLPDQPGSNKATQEILRRLEWKHPELPFPRTPTGKYVTTEEALSGLAAHPFVAALPQFREVEKLHSTFLTKMGKRRLHPSFDVLKTTGRTSSFGEINAQNLPRDDRVRSCFRPSAGHVFIDADYISAELATLAQSLQSQFGLPSEMAKALNEGEDLHRLVAARFTNQRACEVTAEERRKAKPINFGKPGGMGDRTLKAYAKASYGVDLEDEEVAELSRAWLDLFPEMANFLGGDELSLEIARFFRLTPAAHYGHTDSRTFFGHHKNEGREDLPHPFLGSMCLKVLKVADPQKQNGARYPSTDIDFFWTRVAAKLPAIPQEHHAAIHERRPSPQLQRGILRLVGLAPVFTLTGRLRAKASYCARHNTVFQGLAADGAKLALWKLWHAGYRVVNFIHDEFLIEVPAGSRLALHAEIIQRLMIDGMRAVVPDIRIEVAYSVSDRWYKEAKAVLDDKGRLAVWRPSKDVG
jgi:hypothetical protein